MAGDLALHWTSISNAHLMRDGMHVQSHAALTVRRAQPLARAVRGVLTRVTHTFAVTWAHGKRPTVLVSTVCASHRLRHVALALRVLTCAGQPPTVVAGSLLGTQRATAFHRHPTAQGPGGSRPIAGRAQLTKASL
jgi:hypothetical protein